MDKGKIHNKMIQTRGENKTTWLKNVRDVSLHGRQPGSEFRVLCDKHGNPLNLETRRRIKDGDFVPFEKKVQKNVKKIKKDGGK